MNVGEGVFVGPVYDIWSMQVPTFVLFLGSSSLEINVSCLRVIEVHVDKQAISDLPQSIALSLPNKTHIHQSRLICMQAHSETYTPPISFVIELRGYTDTK